MKKALIVVDYQNDFVNGSLGFEKAAALEPAILRKLREYRENGDAILFTFDTHKESYLHTQEGRKLPVTHCVRGTPGWELYGKTAEYRAAAEKIFEKPAFGSLELAEYLARSGFEQVELVGVVSNICVISNAVLAKAALPEAEIVVDASCTASNDDTLNEKVLDVMQGMQITVINRT